MPASYNGSNIFGYAVQMQHMLNPPAEQLTSFFGQSGVASLFGGLRGRVFAVQGLWFGEDLSTLNNAESNFNSYVDGIARTLVDTRGRSWNFVLVKPPQPGGKVLRDGRGFYLPYRAALVGLV
jgi:hypothetical protein